MHQLYCYVIYVELGIEDDHTIWTCLEETERRCCWIISAVVVWVYWVMYVFLLVWLMFRNAFWRFVLCFFYFAFNFVALITGPFWLSSHTCACYGRLA